jgi:membrane protein DedA with SNARE-associated domain
MMAGWFLHFGYVMVFIASAVEGDATLLTATYLAHRGYLRLDLVVLSALLGTIAINQIYFRTARRFGRGRIAELSQRPRYGRVFAWIARYDLPLVVGSRFIYGCRIAIPVACGATGMSSARFTTADLIGAVLWSVIVAAAGWMMGETLEYLAADLRRYEWWIAGAVGIGVVMAALYRWRSWRAVKQP